MPPALPDSITIATRGSPLALWQAAHIEALVAAAHPQVKTSFLVVKTKGDSILDRPLAELGGKGLFVKEIEEAITRGEADMAVHSMKDVPMNLPEGFVIGAMPVRGPAEDVFLSNFFPNPASLPEGARVGSSSPRRKAQILMMRPDLQVVPLRGNIATRLDKLARNEFDAIILAKAGLVRLGLSAPCTWEFAKEEFIPAAGQGALGIEFMDCRKDLHNLLAHMEDMPTRICVESERAFVRELEAGCYAPVAAHAWFSENRELTIKALLAAEDGTAGISGSKTGEASCELGKALAKELRQLAKERGIAC